MKTEIIKITNIKEQGEEIKTAGKIIESGGLVAFPTETVYGLGGDALNPNSSKKIYEAKGRPSDNPLIVHIANVSEIEKLVKKVPDYAKKLIEKYWPGPMTLIFEKSELVPKETTGGLDTVAIRMPSNEIARRLIEESKTPIAAPSANLSGKPSPTMAKHVIEDMDGRIDMIIDGGDSDIGLESTIIDVTEDEPILLRPGYISIEEIQRLVGCGKIDKAVTQKMGADVRPKAPGMKYKHYAPKAPMTIIYGGEDKVVSKINELSAAANEDGKKCGIICTEEISEKLYADVIIELGSKSAEEDIAHNLFKSLRILDEEGVDVIFAEGIRGGKLDMAINNRMLKASGFSIMEV